MPFLVRSGANSRLVLAVALATGVAVGASAPAYAQKKQEQPAQRKANYSKGFVEAHKAVAAAAEAKNYAVVQPAVPGLIAAAQTPDDKFRAGQLAYLTGENVKDAALKKQGLEIMLASGAAETKLTAQIHSELSDIALAAQDFAGAQTHIQKAMEAGLGVNGHLQLARIAFGQKQYAQGLAAMDQAITAQAAAGQPVPEGWYQSAIANASKGNLGPQAIKFAIAYAGAFPSKTSWTDAINIQRNLADYEAQELLDLLRLAQRAGTLQTGRDYADYIRVIDARRLPGEAQRAVLAATTAGLLPKSDPLVMEANESIAQRLRGDEAGLPKLASDARAGGASTATIMAAGDAFLSYGKPAEAEEFYTLALGKPGVDAARVLTRLGIAQLDQRKYAEAQANFAKVQGTRQAIAALWALYAAQAAKGAPIA